MIKSKRLKRGDPIEVEEWNDDSNKKKTGECS